MRLSKFRFFLKKTYIFPFFIAATFQYFTKKPSRIRKILNIDLGFLFYFDIFHSMSMFAILNRKNNSVKVEVETLKI